MGRHSRETRLPANWTDLRSGGPCRGHTGTASNRKGSRGERALLPVHVVAIIALRPAFVSIRRLGRGYSRGAMVAGDAPGRVETVIAWSGGRRLHLLTYGEISEGRRASVEHAASRIVDVDDIEHALERVFRHRVQRRIRDHATVDVWFEVG